MRSELKIVLLIFIIIAISLGCVESQKLPDSNETKIGTLTPTPEQKLPAYNETKPLKINDTFETWSRGYFTKDSDNFSTYNKPYFRVITNYSRWIEFLDDQDTFLDEQGYFAWLRKGGSRRLEGTLFPGERTIPKKIEPVDFKEYFIIAAMMGYQTKLEPEIEIKNISRLNNIINVTVWLYNPSFGLTVLSAPYHIIIIKRELLPAVNSTFMFADTEGKLLGKVEVSE